MDYVHYVTLQWCSVLYTIRWKQWITNHLLGVPHCPLQPHFLVLHIMSTFTPFTATKSLRQTINVAWPLWGEDVLTLRADQHRQWVRGGGSGAFHKRAESLLWHSRCWRYLPGQTLCLIDDGNRELLRHKVPGEGASSPFSVTSNQVHGYECCSPAFRPWGAPSQSCGGGGLTWDTSSWGWWCVGLGAGIENESLVAGRQRR